MVSRPCVLRQVLAYLADIPSGYLRLWVLNMCAALLQLDVVAFANMAPADAGRPSHHPGPEHGRQAAGAGSGSGAGADGEGGRRGEPDGDGGLDEQLMRSQGLAVAVLDRLVGAMQREARAARGGADSPEGRSLARELGGGAISAARGLWGALLRGRGARAAPAAAGDCAACCVGRQRRGSLVLTVFTVVRLEGGLGGAAPAPNCSAVLPGVFEGFSFYLGWANRE